LCTPPHSTSTPPRRSPRNAYLTCWKLPANDGWQPRITLRQLLSHRAGLTVHGFPGYRHDEPLPSVPQILDGEPPANTGPVRVNLIPGTQFRYAGGGTTVAQQAVMDVLGLPFPEIMRTYARVVAPGRLQADNAVILVARPNPGLTIRALNTCFYHTCNAALAERFIAAVGLMDWWRERLLDHASAQPS
jgi:hypothetical protein